jgi:hypothetical protein
MKLPSIYTDMKFEPGFRKCQSRPQLTLPLGCEQRELPLLPVRVPAGSRSRSVTSNARFTGEGLGQLQKITPQPLRNGPILILTFYHKDLGIHHLL